DGVRVEPQAFSQGLDRFVVLGFVRAIMRAFVVVVGAKERFRHRTGLPGRLCYDTTPRTVTQATDAEYLPRRCPPCPPRSRTFRTAPSPRRAASPPRPHTPASRPTARRTRSEERRLGKEWRSQRVAELRNTYMTVAPENVPA